MVLKGPFARFKGTVRSREGDTVVVDVSMFRKTTAVKLKVTDVALAETGPPETR